MENFIRYDSNSVSKVKKHDKGFLTMWANMSRIGVQEYIYKDGSIVRELRLPEEVFKEDSLQSFNNIPVTDNHPDVSIIDIDNAKNYQRGFTGDYTQVKDGKLTMNKVTVTDGELINKIQNGKVEVSLGYECKVEKSTGVHPVYGKYDAIQRDIKGNHLAIVDRGRAGREARLLLDSDQSNIAVIINNKADEMETLKFDKEEFEVSKEVFNAVNNKLDNLNSEIANLKKAVEEKKDQENKKAEKKADEEAKNTEISELKTKVDSLEKSIPSKAREYADAMEYAKDIVELKQDSDLITIKKDACEKKYDINLDGKSEEYINARFDSLVEEVKKDKEEALAKSLTDSKQNKEDSLETLEKSKKEKIINNWKK